MHTVTSICSTESAGNVSLPSVVVNAENMSLLPAAHEGRKFHSYSDMCLCN